MLLFALVARYLCFERNTKPVDPDRCTVSLNNVLQVSKAKPFAVLPGSGMSIEVTLNSGTKVRLDIYEIM